MARRPIRIAVLYFVHETVTFLKNDTTFDDFVYEGSPARGEALLAHEPDLLFDDLSDVDAVVEALLSFRSNPRT